MKEIIIKNENKEKIEAALAAANDRAFVRCITSFDEVCDIVKTASRETKERFVLTNDELEGTEVVYVSNCEPFPNAYNGVPEATAIRMLFRGGKWRLVSVWRQSDFSPPRLNKLYIACSDLVWDFFNDDLVIKNNN